MNISKEVHAVLDVLMFLELVAGSVFVAVSALDWALDRALRSFKLHRCFIAFMVDWVLKGKRRKSGREA